MSTKGKDKGDTEDSIPPAIEATMDTGQSRSVRLRTRTDKGQSYQKDLLSKQLKASYTKIQRQCNLFADLLLSFDVDMVHKESANLDMRLSEALELHNRLLELSHEDEHLDYLSEHSQIDDQVFETKQQICSWLKSQDIASRSGKSSSQRSGSRASSHRSAETHRSKASSKKSAGSKNSNLSTNQMKIVSLEAEQKVLEQRQYAKKVELESKLRHETAKIESEKIIVQQKIIKAKLEEGILPQPQSRLFKENKLEGTDGSQELARVEMVQHNSRYGETIHQIPSFTNNKTMSLDKKNEAKGSDGGQEMTGANTVRHSTLYGETTYQTPSSLSNQTKPLEKKHEDQKVHNNEGNQVIDVMKRLVDLQTAPDIEIDVFSGDPLEYRYFRTTFRDAVESKVQDAGGRLTRLVKYTSGDAKELIKDCIYEDEDLCFDTAIAILDRESSGESSGDSK